VNEHVHEEITTNLPQPVAVSWGAIFAGLFGVLSISWLLYLLGASIGVSVTDAADDTLMDDGLPEMAILWMLLSSLIAYFVGSALASRLANTVDEAVGMMHGFVVWSVATTVMVVMSYYGISALLQTGAEVAKTAGSAAGTTVSTTAEAVGAVGSTVGSAVGSTVRAGAEGTAGLASTVGESEVFERISARLKRRAARAIAAVDPEGGAEVSEEEISAAIDNLDAESIDQLLADLADDDQESAAEMIANETNLSRAQAEELIAGAANELEERLGDPDNDESLAEDLRSQMRSGVAGVIASADTGVSRAEINRALEQLDAESMEEAAYLLLQGETEEATELIVEETDLSRADVEALVSGIQRTYRRQIDQLSGTVSDTVDSVADSASETMEDVAEAASETVETASTYAQQLLWATFASAGLGLAISVLGGWCGVDTHRRLYYDVRKKGAVVPTPPAPIV
jgi:hypothetical protein